MPQSHHQAPQTDEYNEFYRGYIRYVPPGDVLANLEKNLDLHLNFFASASEELQSYRYASGKWSFKEVVGHILDTERVFAYRALCIARGDRTALPGMDQDHFMIGANFGSRTWDSILREYRHQRLSNLALFEGFGADTLNRRGLASGFEFSVRALIYIIAGHEIHHFRVLEDRYLT